MIICPICKNQVQPLPFCPHCGSSLKEDEPASDASMIQGHVPELETVSFSIGPYQVVKSIGKGGMGEVLLAYDTLCGRRIALKRIRQDLLEHKQIYNRFLREARITSQLTHPAIIPIYTIHYNKQHTYYTMPFVEGNTLKKILIQAKMGDKADLLSGSIPYLIRVFLAICQAIAYAHSKSVLHRDLKPENIIIGTYGEVLLLDWGLAKILHEEGIESFENAKGMQNPSHQTLAGKVVGTIGYMAPERALGHPATKGTDIYSLGVILYQILTLKLPFRRKNLKYFRQNMGKEILQDPIEMAPYRDIPKILAQIALKCLTKNPQERYPNVDALIRDLENYIEGRAEWFHTATLIISNKADWEFQEHILIAEHTAITRSAEISEWVKLMISKASFAENIKIEALMTPHAGCRGIGLLFNVPEISERHQINDGYCLWISSDPLQPTTLLRNSVEVLHVTESFMTEGKEHVITLEKIDNTLRLFIDSVEQFTYIERMPLLGTHVGILARDTEFSLKPIKISVGSQNIMINCLAIPDSFLAHKDYQKALSEYRRIGYAFAGRAEGREATLRAGITLLEQGKNDHDPKLFDAALQEFEKLHGTPGAPLEYLGKALVYEHLQDYDEEIKCFELSYRRYPKHPLLHTLQDQILFRLIESSRSDRRAVYQFLLLALCHIPNPLKIPALNNLINYLKLNWEPLEFMSFPKEMEIRTIILTLAFWSHKNYILEEHIHPDDLLSPLVMLAVLDEKALVHKVLSELPLSSYKKERDLLAPFFSVKLEEAFHLLPFDTEESQRFAIPLLDKALDELKPALIYEYLKKIPEPLSESFLSRKLWALLLEYRLKEAGELIDSLPLEKFTEETSLLHFLYGCWLYATEGYEIAYIHWNSVLEVPLPRSFSLGSHYITGKLGSGWYKRAFDWERWQLQRQLTLFERMKQRSIK